jgi:hypothetical protein
MKLMTIVYEPDNPHSQISKGTSQDMLYEWSV